MAHKYAVDQVVELVSASKVFNRPAGTCRIVSLLPHERGPIQYRIQSSGESNQRVVDEDDLRLAFEQPIGSVFEADKEFSIAIKRR